MVTRAISAEHCTPPDIPVLMYGSAGRTERPINLPADSQYYSTMPPPSLQLYMSCYPLLPSLPSLRGDLSIHPADLHFGPEQDTVSPLVLDGFMVP